MTQIWGDCSVCNQPTHIMVEEAPLELICPACEYKEIRATALEDAAKVAESFFIEQIAGWMAVENGKDIAAEIRRLKGN